MISQLTKSLAARLSAANYTDYASDVALFESITQPATVVTK
jgi:hypothetical protein